jgi:nucleotide-binding universal stress UspA family protein
MYGKILVGTDLSATSRVAVDRASQLAAELGAELTLLYVGEDPGEPLEKLGEEHKAAGVAVPGNPAEVLISEAVARGADLLVVGSVGMSGARRFMLGNVPNKVSHHTETDLLIVKTDKKHAASGGYRKILVGTDGSPTAMRAVEMAGRLASELKVAPTIVTAYEPPTEQELKRLRGRGNEAIGQWSASRTQKDTPSEFQWRIAGAAQAEDILERAFDRAAKQGVEAEVRAIEGSPAETLLGVAEKERFDLIAVGSVGMSGPKRFMLGNVPHRLTHHTPTDILILRTA